jgi:hypothetical protein
MSDTAINKFLQYGTNAQRLAFTPSPAAGTQPIYEWYESDTDTTWIYTTGWHQVSGSGGGVTASGTLTAGKVIIGNGTSVVTASSTTATVTKLTAGTPSAATDGTDYVSPTTQRVIQVVNVETGAVATGTTTIPRDDTIPQNTEGTEFMTLAITPTSATNKLKIEVVAYFSSNAANTIIGALFQDTTADALAAGMTFDDFSVIFTHYMTAGTTSSTTFKVRLGGSSASTITFNGVAAGRIFGGVMASSITISEIKV